jgi:hypothetical protein
MSRYSTIILPLLLFVCGCEQDDVLKGTKNLPLLTLHLSEGKGYGHQGSVEYYDDMGLIFHNNQKDTIGFYCLGNIIDKWKLGKDVLLEVVQGNKRIASKDVKLSSITVDDTALLMILPSDSVGYIIISHALHLRDIFQLTDEPFKIRAIYCPLVKALKEDEQSWYDPKVNYKETTLKEYYLRYQKQHPHIKMLEDSIVTPYVDVPEVGVFERWRRWRDTK